MHRRRHQEFLDEQPRHDRLARARIVRQHIAERLLGQHLFVDGGYLMRQRDDVRRMNRHHRIERTAQVDAKRLERKLEVRRRSYKRPGQVLRRDGKARFIRPVKLLLCDAQLGFGDNRHHIRPR